MLPVTAEDLDRRVVEVDDPQVESCLGVPVVGVEPGARTSSTARNTMPTSDSVKLRRKSCSSARTRSRSWCDWSAVTARGSVMTAVHSRKSCAAAPAARASSATSEVAAENGPRPWAVSSDTMIAKPASSRESTRMPSLSAPQVSATSGGRAMISVPVGQKISSVRAVSTIIWAACSADHRLNGCPTTRASGSSVTMAAACEAAVERSVSRKVPVPAESTTVAAIRPMTAAPAAAVDEQSEHVVLRRQPRCSREPGGEDQPGDDGLGGVRQAEAQADLDRAPAGDVRERR